MKKVIYYCDKCGEEIGDELSTRFEVEAKGYGVVTVEDFNAELCKNCRDLLIDWMKSKPKPLGRPRKIDRDKLLALWKAGWSAEKIADELKAPLAQVNKVIEEFPVGGEEK